MGAYNYRRFIRRHLDRVGAMMEKEGVKLFEIAEQYEKDHPEISGPLHQCSAGAKIILDVIQHVKTLI